VGGTHLRLCRAWLDADGVLQHTPVQRLRWHEDTAHPTVADLAAVLKAHIPEGPPVTAIGMGFAGQLSVDRRVVLNAPAFGWRNVRLAEELEDALAIPRGGIELLNDLKAILAGEIAAGAARGASPVLAFYVGTGVGGALAIDGRVQLGAGGNAGEIGHVKLLGFQGLCGCGERGCVEARAGGGALTRWLRDAAQGEGRHLADAKGELGLAAWDAAASAGDAWAAQTRAEVADALAHVLAGATTFTNPALVLTGGGVFEHAPGLAQLVIQRAGELTLAACRANVRYAAGQLGDSAGVLGAAGVALQRGSSEP